MTDVLMFAAGWYGTCVLIAYLIYTSKVDVLDTQLKLLRNPKNRAYALKALNIAKRQRSFCLLWPLLLLNQNEKKSTE